jgi:hypothetical protein
MATRNAELALRVSFEANLSPAYAADPGHFDMFKATSLAVKVPSVVAGMQFQAALAHDTRDRLPTVSAPTLVLHGTADEMLGSAQGELIAGLVPGARLELFDGVGHLFWWEQPERAAALLREHATGHTLYSPSPAVTIRTVSGCPPAPRNQPHWASPTRHRSSRDWPGRSPWPRTSTRSRNGSWTAHWPSSATPD